MKVVSLRRKSIQRLQEELLKLPQVPINTGHFFCNGMYIRVVLIPKDHVLVGRVHRHEHFFMVISGDISIANEGTSVRYKGASMPLVSKPGAKRAGRTYEDTLVMTIHRTDKTDLAEIEEDIFEPAPESAYGVGNVLKPNAFGAMCHELGYTEAQVRTISESTADLTDFPPATYKIRIGASKIEGFGLIATDGIENGETICPGRILGKRTPAGRYTNHSDSPNAEVFAEGQDLYIFAKQAIAKEEEITLDYRQVIATKARIGQ